MVTRRGPALTEPFKEVGHPPDNPLRTTDDKGGDDMHWDVRLTEANLVVADLIGAAMGRRPAEDDDEDASDQG
jgi:hypothetical protein